MSSLRGSTSRSYVVPLTVTETSISAPAASSARARREHRGEVRPVLGGRVDVGRRHRASPPARRRRLPSGESAVTSTGTASTQPSATRTEPFTVAAALQMHVPSAPSVTAAKPSFLPAGIEIRVSSSPCPTAVR